MADLEQMKHQQRVLADFGELALRSEDLDEVLAEACRLVSEALGTDLAKIMECEAGEQSLLLRAGIGWPPGVVGHARVSLNERSSEEYSFKAMKPVCTPDIREETRFDYPDFMKEAGVVGMINVPIHLPGGKAYGLLQVDSREPWQIGEHETEFLRTYTSILGPVIDRLHKAHSLREAVQRNETLLHELQHRIKNNIGAITSLVRMRMNRVQSEDARGELRIVGERVEALRLVHEQVYAAKGGDRLQLRSYVAQLLQGLLALHGETPARLHTEIEDVEIRSDTAIPLGLILNEFTTNSLKYAFEGNDRERNVIGVEAHQRADRLCVRICDNGKGLPAEAQPARPGFGTGMALMGGLARQIGAKPEWSSEGGTALCLEFPRRA